MATIREIRRKLQSVKNIQKITQAMEMVAAAHLRRAQSKAEMARPYFNKLKEILEDLIAADNELVHPLVVQRTVKKTGVIVIAGDRGLCGSYNQSVFSAAEKFLKHYSFDQVELSLIGRKAADHFTRKKWPIKDQVLQWGGKITYLEIAALTEQLIQRYLAKELDEIWLIYTHYINVSTRKVIIEKFLSLDSLKPEKKIKVPNYIFEPNSSEIFAGILPRYCIAKIQSALNESYISELAARIFSMRAATENSEEMIEKLTLVRNKIRQTGITRELIEITSGAESVK